MAVESQRVPATDDPKTREPIDDVTQGSFDWRGFRAALPGDYPDLADSNPEARLVFAEAQLARTEKFLDRLHDQASPILTSEQLRRLDQIHVRQLVFERKRVEALRHQLRSTP